MSDTAKEKKKRPLKPDEEPPIDEQVEFLGKPPKRKETRITYLRKSPNNLNFLDTPQPNSTKLVNYIYIMFE